MRLFKFSFLSGVLLLILFSCSSDDNTTTAHEVETGYYIYNGIEYPLKAGTIQNYDGWTGINSKYILRLFTTDLSINENDKITFDDDVFNLLDFRLNSKSESTPKTGLYTYNEGKHFDFSCSDFFILLNTKYTHTYLSEGVLNVKKGWVNVLKSGAVYEIEFEFISQLSNSSISGYYKGKLSELQSY